MPTFADNDFQLYYVNDINTRLLFDMANLPSGTFVTLSVPAVSGNIKLALANYANIFTVQQIFVDNSVDAPIVCNISAVSTNPYFEQVNDVANAFNMLLGIPVAGFTRNRIVNWQDQTGNIVLAGANADPPPVGAIGKVNRTVQGADIASTKLTDTTVTGMYRVGYVLEDTTSDVTAGILTLTISWTDDVGATTATATQALTGTGRAQGTVALYLASGNITYAVTHTGIYGAAKYALRMRCEAIG